jgi:hypothetical protein
MTGRGRSEPFPERHCPPPARHDPEPPVANVGFAALELSSPPGDAFELFARRS